MQNRIEKQIDIAAPVSQVWHALTDPIRFGQWFGVKLEGPFLAGSPVGGHITHPGYEHLRMELIPQAVDPETFFSYTWHPFAIDPEVDYSQETPTLVEFRLTPTSTGTYLTVTESGFENIPASRREEAFRMNDSGWAQQTASIKAYVERS